MSIAAFCFGLATGVGVLGCWLNLQRIARELRALRIEHEPQRHEHAPLTFEQRWEQRNAEGRSGQTRGK